MTDSPSPTELRKQLRLARRQLDSSHRLANELGICKRLLNLPEVRRSRRVGLYLSEDGEVDLSWLLLELQWSGVRCYLPVLRPGRSKRLWFAAFRPGDRLVDNRFGIAEPITRYNPPIDLRRLDLVLMPLVGFDAQLNRLGMGGGYYDRTFAALGRGDWRRPRLIGVAHECQRVERLQPRPWDLPMDAVITESRLYRHERASNQPLSIRQTTEAYNKYSCMMQPSNI